MTIDIESVPLEVLAQQCALETRRFLDRQVEHDTRYCYEVFRRAFVVGNQDAYALICGQYSSIVANWVRARLRSAALEEALEECVNWAFASMFHSLSRPGAFAKFESLGHLLAYMRSCAFSAAETENRKNKIMDELTESLVSTEEEPERSVIRAETIENVRRIVLPLLKDERERIVYECYFALDLAPRVIYEMNPTVFTDVRDVHRVKQVMLERIGRALRTIGEEYLR